MATYTNPKGSPAVQYNGRVSFAQQEIADTCRKWAPRLNAPAGIDRERFLWAFTGRESSFGADCRPRHEIGYCTGRYSTAPDVVAATKYCGHLAHCSFGPWQMLYVNDHEHPDPELFGNLDFAAMRTIAFFNAEIFGHQKAQTIQQAADAWNSGNFRDKNVPTDYIDDVLHFYSNVPMPPAITIQASTGKDANSLYADLTGAVERLGPGLHLDALVDVPVLVNFDGKISTVTGSAVQVTGSKIDSITLNAAV